MDVTVTATNIHSSDIINLKLKSNTHGEYKAYYPAEDIWINPMMYPETVERKILYKIFTDTSLACMGDVEYTANEDYHIKLVKG